MTGKHPEGLAKTPSPSKCNNGGQDMSKQIARGQHEVFLQGACVRNGFMSYFFKR